MANITFAIEIMAESGKADYVPLAEKNEKDAIKAMRQYVTEHRNQGQNMFLYWHRNSDGCQGYINPDGSANPTGTAWK